MIYTEAQVIAHTTAPKSPDVLSLVLKYPYFIHAELLRHRNFAHSAQSMRAIGYRRMREMLMRDGMAEIWFYGERKGMVAGEMFDEIKQELFRNIWHKGMINAIRQADELIKMGVHHALVNRLLLPYLPIAHIMTGTRPTWDYFIELRSAPDAEPHAQILARAIEQAINESSPTGEMVHIPWGISKWVAVARCAKVSYLNYAQQINVDEAKEFCKRLWRNAHYSPFEHVVVFDPKLNVKDPIGGGWVTLRNIPGYVESKLMNE